MITVFGVLENIKRLKDNDALMVQEKLCLNRQEKVSVLCGPHTAAPSKGELTEIDSFIH